MLLPRKTKFRKVQRGHRRGLSKGQTAVQFGDYGLKALEAGWVTNRQIEAARIAMTRKIRRGGKVWINKGEIMPEGYVGMGQKETRLGEQDQARRRRGSAEGLGAGRDGGRDRRADREGLGPVRQRRRGGGRPGQRDRARGQDNVERPRTDEAATSAEGREQPVVEPQVETTPAPVADAPDTTTPKTMHEQPQKLDQSGDPAAESSGGEGSGSRRGKKGRS